LAKLKVKDKVYTKQGSRKNGNPGQLTIIETGRSWLDFEAVICKRKDGTRRLYLLKNLYKKTPRKKAKKS